MENTITEARNHFLSQVQAMKNSNSLTPAKIAELQPSHNLNLIFDIDHTLVYSIAVHLYPDLQKDHADSSNIFKINVAQMGQYWVIIRYGVPELLKYLRSFCEFYVYSHGLKSYVLEVLKNIDPNEQYFKNRDQRVLAPKNFEEQKFFSKRGKNLVDFKELSDPAKPLFRSQDLDQTLIIDDQYMTIANQSHLIISKKFLQYANECANASPDQHVKWNIYQFPTHKNPVLLNHDIKSDAHKELNGAGQPNQLYYIGNLITRIWMTRVLLAPTTSIQDILQEFKKSIFKSQKFYLENFLCVTGPSEQSFDEQTLKSARQMKRACQNIIPELGGRVTDKADGANFIVLYETHAKSDILQSCGPKQKLINYKYVTECYFQMIRLNLDSKTEKEFGIDFIVKEKQ